MGLPGMRFDLGPPTSLDLEASPGKISTGADLLGAGGEARGQALRDPPVTVGREPPQG